MKDRKNMVMVIIIGITISLFLCFNTTVFATTGTVTASDLRLRKEENTSSEILTLLDENTQVEILSENGDWYKVKANDKVGFVNKQFIKVKDDNNVSNENPEQNLNQNSDQNSANNESTEKKEEQQNQVEQNNEKETIINKIQQATVSSEEQIRLVPLINGDIINTTKSGEKYDIVSNVGVWSYVKNSEKKGWILTGKLTIVDENNNSDQKEENTPEGNTPNENTENSNVNEEQNNKQEQPKNEEKKEEPTEKTYSKSKTYYVKGNSVNVRSDKSKTSEVIEVYNTNEQVKVTGEDGDWYVVSVNGKKAYIKKSLLSAKKVETTSRSSTNVQNQEETKQSAPAETTTTASNPNGAAIVAYAKGFVGYPYVYGNNGPNSFDCSGFVQYVYKHFGYSLSRSSKTQANDGVAVSRNNLQPGDIIIFKNTAKTAIGHVGIYIGDGQFVHASNSRTGVIISSLSTSAYQQRYVTARRIL